MVIIFFNYVLMVYFFVFFLTIFFLKNYLSSSILFFILMMCFFYCNINFFCFSISLWSFFFVFLSLFLVVIMSLFYNNMLIYSSFLLIFLMAFLTNNFFLFFIFFELSLIPTYYLVLSGASPERSVAGNYLILYTFFGSLPLLFSSLANSIYSSFFFIEFFSTFDYFPFWFFSLAFLIKLPIFFFHLWLPKAHVEASTEGSMVLAGILLKLGSYGLLLMSPYFNINFWLVVLVSFGGIYAGFFSFLNLDLKMFIAYSSIIHMSLIVLNCLFSTHSTLLGVTLMSVGHGFISANLFFLLSAIYSVTNSRNLLFLNSNSNLSYFYMFCFGVSCILNSSAPFSINFFGELLLFIGVSVIFGYWGFIFIFFMNVIGGILSIMLFMILFHGYNSVNSFCYSSSFYLLSFVLSLYSIFSLVLFSVYY